MWETMQTEIKNGNNEMFETFFRETSKDVHARAVQALGNAEKAAKEAVKQIYKMLYDELKNTAEPVDAAARLDAITKAVLPFDINNELDRLCDELLPEKETSKARPASEDDDDDFDDDDDDFDDDAEDVDDDYLEDLSNDTVFMARVSSDRRRHRKRGENDHVHYTPIYRRLERVICSNRRLRWEYRSLRIALTVVSCVLGLIVLWAAAGLLMRLSILPAIDLGYTFVARNLFPML